MDSVYRAKPKPFKSTHQSQYFLTIMQMKDLVENGICAHSSFHHTFLSTRTSEGLSSLTQKEKRTNVTEKERETKQHFCCYLLISLLITMFGNQMRNILSTLRNRLNNTWRLQILYTVTCWFSLFIVSKVYDWTLQWKRE